MNLQDKLLERQKIVLEKIKEEPSDKLSLVIRLLMETVVDIVAEIEILKITKENK